MKPRQKARIMRSYANYVKRHNFVFNRQGEKQYLSKNPLMMCKIASLSVVFPDAIILNINRTPAKTLPSTLMLNKSLYSLFTSQPVTEDLNEKTLQILIKWYRMAEKNLKQFYTNQHIKIDFTKLVTQDKEEVERISKFLGIPSELLQANKKNVGKKHKSENIYNELTEKQLKQVLIEIPFMADYS